MNTFKKMILISVFLLSISYVKADIVHCCINVTATLNPSVTHPNYIVNVYGNAIYDTTYGKGEPVTGALVTVTILETGSYWTTHTIASGDYNINVIAPETLEKRDYTVRINITDFTFVEIVDKTLTVKPLCEPESCDILLYLVQSKNGANCGDSSYDPVADVTKDRKIDVDDLSAVAWRCNNPEEKGWCQEKLNDKTDPCHSCTDSDGGKNYFVKGTVIVCTYTGQGGGCGGAVDQCGIDRRTLTEGYCNNTQAKSIKYTCPGICTDGKCVSGFGGCSRACVQLGLTDDSELMLMIAIVIAIAIIALFVGLRFFLSIK